MGGANITRGYLKIVCFNFENPFHLPTYDLNDKYFDLMRCLHFAE